MGNDSNKNPMATITISTRILVIAEWRRVFAPVPSRITHLDSPTHNGKPRKNELRKFPSPYTNNSFTLISKILTIFIKQNL